MHKIILKKVAQSSVFSIVLLTVAISTAFYAQDLIWSLCSRLFYLTHR